jgi:hypothetical protein
MAITAYAWRSGLIQFTTPKRRPRVPAGAIAIARGPREIVRMACEVNARLGMGKSAGKLLVPGIPEADSSAEALAALHEFKLRVHASMGKQPSTTVNNGQPPSTARKP